LALILPEAKLFDGVNLYLCRKGLINQIKNEPRKSTASEKGCGQRMAAMSLKEGRLKAEKN